MRDTDNRQIDRKIEWHYDGYTNRQEGYIYIEITNYNYKKTEKIEREEHRSSKSKRKEKGDKKNREI